VKTELANVTAQPAAKDPAKTAAKQLEAFFLRQLLKEARPQGAGMLDGGFAGDTFKDMLDEALADKMSAAGGMGMANMFAKQLGPTNEVSFRPDQVAPASLPGPSIDGMQLAMPVPGHVGSGYGPRVGHNGLTHQHPGVDLTARMGDPIAAAAPGTVTHAGPAGTYGNLVIVKHENGYQTRYAHMSSVGVQVGQQVSSGQALGQVGSTGLSDGPHLHFEVRKGDQAIDPTAFLPLKGSTGRTSR
jgi:murein DD-endopeptidase MepM/ murein hydrolase activator NlpD